MAPSATHEPFTNVFLSESVTSLRQATVVGTGAMGTLCAVLLADRGLTVRLWGRSPNQVRDLNRYRENRRYFPGLAIPDNVSILDDPVQALHQSGLVISAVPCQYVRTVWTRFAPHSGNAVPIVSVAKGLELDSLLTPTEVIQSCLGPRPLACLSGPCIAPEVAARKPTSLVVASRDRAVAELVQRTFSTPSFRVYTSNDLVGVELAGAVKNVIALAAGICDGIDGGDNAKASLLTRGLAEITRLGLARGALPETFSGLAGMGDLLTTCISAIGRNRRAGERIGRGESSESVVASTPSVIEGIPTTRAVLELARRHGVEMPIVSAVASVLFEDDTASAAINRLMTRPLKTES